jgi:hypothetical protein
VWTDCRLFCLRTSAALSREAQKSANDNLSTKCSGLLLRSLLSIWRTRARHLFSAASIAAFSMGSRPSNSLDTARFRHLGAERIKKAPLPLPEASSRVTSWRLALTLRRYPKAQTTQERPVRLLVPPHSTQAGAENTKLKKLLAEAMLDNAILKEIAAKKW